MNVVKKSAALGIILLAIAIGAGVYESRASRKTEAALAVVTQRHERARQHVQRLLASCESTGNRLAELGIKIDALEKTGNSANVANAGEPDLPPIDNPAPEKTVLVKQIFAAAAEGRIDADLFEPWLAADIPNIKSRSLQTMTEHGKVVSVEFVDQIRRQGQVQYRHRVLFERGGLHFDLGFGKEGKINHIAFLNY